MPKTDISTAIVDQKGAPHLPPADDRVNGDKSVVALSPAKRGAGSPLRGHNASKGGRNAIIQVAPYSQAMILKMTIFAATVS